MTVPAGNPSPRPSPVAIVVVLALLLALQPVTTDLYLPALPALTADFGAPMARAQLTLSALMFAFGVSQLLMGPLADRFGRRPVMVGGLTLYAAASAGSAAAASIESLVGWRMLQGIGMAAAVVCARAMVRDLFEPHDGARIMSKALSGLGIIALSCPVVGGLVATAFGWRSSLAMTGIFAAGTLAIVLASMPETLRQPNPKALRLAPMFATWVRIARNPTFMAWSLLTACTYAGLYTYLAGSAFVYIDVLGVSRGAYGLFLATSSVAYLAGTVWCRRWLLRHGLAGAVKRGAFFTLAGGLGMAALSLAGLHNPWAIALPQLLFAFGHGLHQPCGQAAVTGPFPANAGAASALAGFMLALAAVAIGGWLGVSMNGTVYPLTLTVGAMAVLTATVAWTLVQRHGEMAPAAAAG
jgi:DHA1 family bicyclomycin/chloramphenicol resistance-like MFS transporter